MAIATARSIFRSSPIRNAVNRLVTKSGCPLAPSRSVPCTRPAHRILRHPVELSAMLDSMQPYHTATAASLMISNLTVSRCGYGWLVEDIYCVERRGFYRWFECLVYARRCADRAEIYIDFSSSAQ